MRSNSASVAEIHVRHGGYEDATCLDRYHRPPPCSRHNGEPPLVKQLLGREFMGDGFGCLMASIAMGAAPWQSRACMGRPGFQNAG
jgi:hypothetical protein